MTTGRREFLAGVIGAAALQSSHAAQAQRKRITVGLVQFDTVPEKTEHNLKEMERLTEQAVASGARWVMFHESSVVDYTARLTELAERVPSGPSTRRMEKVAQRLKCCICFGHSEVDANRYYITQIFIEPSGFVYRYRKTWVFKADDDSAFRNEWARYDPGTGPEAFTFDGVRATCFICADGESPRCVQRAAEVRPSVIFYPNNRTTLPPFERFGARARIIGAPMLVTNRTGLSWKYNTKGGCVVFSETGEVLAKANREGREEILVHTLDLPCIA